MIAALGRIMAAARIPHAERNIALSQYAIKTKTVREHEISRRVARLAFHDAPTARQNFGRH